VADPDGSGEGDDLDREAADEDHGPERPDMRVFHGCQACISVTLYPETVGRVREAVEVKSAGDPGERGDRNSGGEEIDQSRPPDDRASGAFKELGSGSLTDGEDDRSGDNPENQTDDRGQEHRVSSDASIDSRR
jgi:hypothetical protein